MSSTDVSDASAWSEDGTDVNDGDGSDGEEAAAATDAAGTAAGAAARAPRARSAQTPPPDERELVLEALRVKRWRLQRVLAHTAAVPAAQGGGGTPDADLVAAVDALRAAAGALDAGGDPPPHPAPPPASAGGAAAAAPPPPTTDAALREAAVALADSAAATVVGAVATAAAWVTARAVEGEVPWRLADRAKRAAALVKDTVRGLARRSSDAEERPELSAAARSARTAAGRTPPACARCRSRAHTTRSAACPAKAWGGAANAHVYDRGEDPAVTDPYANRATVTTTVTVPLPVLVRALPPPGGAPPSPETAAAAAATSAAVTAEFEAVSRHHTHFDFCLRLLWLNTVHRLYAAVGAAGWAAAFPATPAGWTDYWHWAGNAVSCAGAEGGTLSTGDECGTCGQARKNKLSGPAYARLQRPVPAPPAARPRGAAPALVAATQAALADLAPALDAPCHEHLPANNDRTRWTPTVTRLAHTTAQRLERAFRGLAGKVTDGAPAAVGAPGSDGRCRVFATARWCFARAVDAPTGAAATKFEAAVPDPAVRAAVLGAIAALRARVQPSAPAASSPPATGGGRARPVAAGPPPLFPTGGAAAVARRWWAYIPFLLAVQREGVRRPFALIPGKAASLHMHGTLTKRRLHRLVNHLGLGDEKWRKAVESGGAATLAARLPGAPLGRGARTVGANLTTNGVAVAFSVSRTATPAEAEASDVAAATRRRDGARVRPRLAGSPVTQLEKQGCPVAGVKTLTLVSADPGVGTVLTAVSSGPTAAQWAPRPRVWALRLARARLVAGEALLRAALAVDAVVTGAAHLSESATATVEAAADAAAGPAPAVAPRRAPRRHVPARRQRPSAAGEAGPRSPASQRRRVSTGPAAGGGTARDGTAAAPAAAAAADSARPPGGGGSAPATAPPGAVAGADAAHRGRRRLRSVRGAARRARRAGRVDLCAAVRALLAATGRGRWRVPRHAAVRVARSCLPQCTRGMVVADTDGGRPPPEAYGVDRAGAMAADRAAAGAYAAALGGLAARVRVATHASRGYHAPPPAGAVYTLSRGRYHEAGGNGMTTRAVAAHRAAAVERIAQLGDAAGVRTPEQVTEHASICVADSEAVRVASRAWLIARRKPLYSDLWGASGTRGRRAARLNAVLQRGRFAAQVARELTGGRLRRVVNGAVVAVAIGDAATRGGASHLRRRLRHLCWTVDVPERNTSAACDGCHTRLALVYPSPAAPPRVPRGTRVCGRRRGARGRTGRPSSAHRRWWDRSAPLRYARRRAACRAEAANAAAARAAAHPRPHAGPVFRAHRKAVVWCVKVCVEPTCARGMVNRDVTAAANIGWRTWQAIRGRPCYPFRTAAHVRWPRVDWNDRTGGEEVERAAGGGPGGAGRTPADPPVAASGEGGGAAAGGGGAAPPA